MFEIPNDETAASVLLAANMPRNIRTQTMRAFTAAEVDKILAKIPSQVQPKKPTGNGNSVTKTQDAGK